MNAALGGDIKLMSNATISHSGFVYTRRRSEMPDKRVLCYISPVVALTFVCFELRLQDGVDTLLEQERKIHKFVS